MHARAESVPPLSGGDGRVVGTLPTTSYGEHGPTDSVCRRTLPLSGRTRIIDAATGTYAAVPFRERAYV